MRTCLAWIGSVHTCNMCNEDVFDVDTVVHTCNMCNEDCNMCNEDVSGVDTVSTYL